MASPGPEKTPPAGATEDDPSRTDDLAAGPFRARLALDLPIIGLAAAGAMIALVEVAPPACWPDCTPPSLHALDALALGHFSEAAHTAADVAVLCLVLAPLIAELVLRQGRLRWAGVVVYVETLLVTAALVQLVKSAVGRTAPFVYGSRFPEAALASPDAPRSFFSGHTATAFAAAAFLIVALRLWRVDARWRRPLAAVALTAAAATGLLKIFAGFHYPTDVIAGALAGASIGVLVPSLHRR